MFKDLLRNKLALSAFSILVIIVFFTIFADFFSPCHYNDIDARYSWAPPTHIHFFDSKRGIYLRPFVYAYKYRIDQYHRRIYYEDKSKIYPIKFFSRGYEYKLFGLFKTNIHFFTSNTRIYLLGADNKGRDIFSRLLYGARYSLSIALIGVAISFLIGVFVGAVSGYFSGVVDNIIMRLVEMIMMIPSFYLMLALRAAFPPNLSSAQVYLLIVIILSFINWASVARVVRGISLSLREREFVLAAKVAGMNSFLIIVKHIIPHTFSYVIVSICLSIPGYILGEAALSMIGLGIQEPQPSWGNMLAQAMGVVHIKFAPWILSSGVAIIVTVMCFNILGDFLRHSFQVKKEVL